MADKILVRVQTMQDYSPNDFSVRYMKVLWENLYLRSSKRAHLYASSDVYSYNSHMPRNGRPFREFLWDANGGLVNMCVPPDGSFVKTVKTRARPVSSYIASYTSS